MRPDTLFHWSPTERRDLIQREGLRPGCEPVTCSAAGIDYLCLTPDPASGWNLSGAMPWAPAGRWDLWQVRLDSEYEVRLRVEGGVVLEVKVHVAIPPERLWLIGTRVAVKVPEKAGAAS